MKKKTTSHIPLYLQTKNSVLPLILVGFLGVAAAFIKMNVSLVDGAYLDPYEEAIETVEPRSPFAEPFLGEASLPAQPALVIAPEADIFTRSQETTYGEMPALYMEGIIAASNEERAKEELTPLVHNDYLNYMAQKKLDDILAQQYFDHVSPDGVSISDLATEAGYEYIRIGENLAMGGFSDNHDVVTAWMNSPGHRANIMSESFTEIGVAVKKGRLKGHIVWVAVQEFGLPRNACPYPDTQLKTSVENIKTQLSIMKGLLTIRREGIEETRLGSKEHRHAIDQYNIVVNTYNELLSKERHTIDSYNKLIESYNACAKKK